MKIISHNIWGGKVFAPLMEFVKEHAADTDFFCFQEVFDTPTDRVEARDGARANIFTELESALPDFVGHFHSAQSHYEYGHQIHGPSNFDISYGLASFVKKNILLSAVGELFVHKERNDIASNGSMNLSRNIQYLQWMHGDKPYTIINFHGLWHPTIKKIDYDERIEQSRKLRAFLDSLPGEKILCGDFNLNPDTESFMMLKNGMRDLIEEYGITSTRSELYPKPIKFADYTLVTPGVKVLDFSVPSVTASDHLPMILTFA